MTITKKEILVIIKRANKDYGLDLDLRYEDTKPQIFRKHASQKILNPAGLSTIKLFYWLNAWVDGYSVRVSEEGKNTSHWVKRFDLPIPCLEK